MSTSYTITIECEADEKLTPQRIGVIENEVARVIDEHALLPDWFDVQLVTIREA